MKQKQKILHDLLVVLFLYDVQYAGNTTRPSYRVRES